MATTIRDVAKAAGVSVGTVSKVLNARPGPIAISEKTREKVLRAAAELEYFPNAAARRLTSQRSHVVGVVIDSYARFAGTVNSLILKGIGEALEEAEYSLQLVAHKKTLSEDRSLRELVMSGAVDGLLIWSVTSDPSFCDFLRDKGVPHCHISYMPTTQECPAVLTDNVGAARSATQHLIDQGHRSICAIAPQGTLDGAARIEGYRQALEENGIPYNPAWVVQGQFQPLVEGSGLDVEGLERLLPECTAVFASTDNLAVAAKQVIERMGYRLGRERALVGFDGLMMTKYLTPPITTVAQETTRIGALATERVLREIGGERQEGWTLFPARLIVRESSSHCLQDA